jgi:uncharacterized protein (TIGR03437 family)
MMDHKRPNGLAEYLPRTDFMRVRSAFLMLATYAAFAIAAQAAPPSGCGSLNAGYQVLSIPTVPGGSQYSGALRMAIWYPTTATPQSYAYWNTISGMVAQNAPITNCGNPATNFPLVVFSHGYSGCGIQIVFYTEELARQGYIVAAPDHQDRGCQIDSNVPSNPNNYFAFENFLAAQPQTFMEQSNYRNLDIDNVVNYMLNSWTYKAQVDSTRIGISGHSFGGYTTFAKIGGWPSWLPTSYSFKAGLMFAPYIQVFQVANAVGGPDVPMMYQGGTADCLITPWVKGPVPKTTSPGAFQQSQFPSGGGSKYFVELDQSSDTVCLGHFAWVNTTCGGSSTDPTTVQACLANVPAASLIVNWSEAFLDTYVAGQPTSADTALLQSTGSGLATYWSTAGVPGGTYIPGSPAAPNSIASIKGQYLAPNQNVVQNGSLNMPMQLSGVSVTVNGTPAPLYGVDPAQINFVVPSNLAPGFYTVTAEDANGNVIAQGPISTNTVSPAFFSILPGPNASNLNVGWGWGWAQQGGNITGVIYNALARSANPISVAQGNTYLALAANGIRYATDLQATINGTSVPVVGVPSPLYQGIDQVNLGPIPASLAGSGTVQIVLTAGGVQSNAVAAVFQ